MANKSTDKNTSGNFADIYELAKAAAKEAEKSLGGDHSVAVVLGSGWGEALGEIGNTTGEVLSEQLPGFMKPTVEGHGGRILSLETDKRKVLLFQGRTHLYEGHSGLEVTHSVRTAWAAGCEVIILTNAAGAINPEYAVGEPVLISDHINLTGTSALVGAPPSPERGVRFVDMTEAYSKRLRDLARQISPDLKEGVYGGFLGPQYETPAEVAMAKKLGADLAGMSTVLECIAARYMGLEVMGVSLVTNAAAGASDEKLDHEDVLKAGKESSKRVGAMLKGVIDAL